MNSKPPLGSSERHAFANSRSETNFELEDTNPMSSQSNLTKGLSLKSIGSDAAGTNTSYVDISAISPSPSSYSIQSLMSTQSEILYSQSYRSSPSSRSSRFPLPLTDRANSSLSNTSSNGSQIFASPIPQLSRWLTSSRRPTFAMSRSQSTYGFWWEEAQNSGCSYLVPEDSAIMEKPLAEFSEMGYTRSNSLLDLKTKCHVKQALKYHNYSLQEIYQTQLVQFFNIEAKLKSAISFIIQEKNNAALLYTEFLHHNLELQEVNLFIDNIQNVKDIWKNSFLKSLSYCLELENIQPT